MVGEALVTHPDVAMISFTGSAEGGSKVGEVAGRGAGRAAGVRVIAADDRRAAPELEIVVLRPRGALGSAGLLLRGLLRFKRRERPVRDPALEVLHARELLIQGTHRIGVTLDGEVLDVRDLAARGQGVRAYQTRFVGGDAHAPVRRRLEIRISCPCQPRARAALPAARVTGPSGRCALLCSASLPAGGIPNAARANNVCFRTSSTVGCIGRFISCIASLAFTSRCTCNGFGYSFE